LGAVNFTEPVGTLAGVCSLASPTWAVHVKFVKATCRLQITWVADGRDPAVGVGVAPSRVAVKVPLAPLLS
jgi:hypothetical protein